MRALGGQMVTGAELRHADEDEREDAEHEGIGRDCERRAGLTDAPEVEHHDHGDDKDGDENFAALHPADRRRDVGHARADRDSNRQHVVDHQRGRHRDAGTRAEIDRRYLVVAATARVGMNVLPVRRHHDQHEDGDTGGGVPGVVDVGEATRRQDDEDFLGGVCDRGERVTGEDGQRDLFREQRLAELRAAHRPPDEQALEDVPERGHGDRLRPRSSCAWDATPTRYRSQPCMS